MYFKETPKAKCLRPCPTKAIFYLQQGLGQMLKNTFNFLLKILTFATNDCSFATIYHSSLNIYLSTLKNNSLMK